MEPWETARKRVSEENARMDYRSDGELSEVIMRGLASAVRTDGALTDTQTHRSSRRWAST